MLPAQCSSQHSKASNQRSKADNTVLSDTLCSPEGKRGVVSIPSLLPTHKGRAAPLTYYSSVNRTVIATGEPIRAATTCCTMAVERTVFGLPAAAAAPSGA